MKYIYHLVTGAVLFALLTTNPVLSDPPPGKGNPNKSNQGNNGNNGNNSNNGNNGQGQGNDQSSVSDLTLNSIAAGISALTAQNLARNYGMVGYSPLPPGIAKNLARGKPLPPGIAKKYPSAMMLNQLPAHPGYEWRVAGTDLILVSIGTLIVADILKNVFR